jgi:DNA-binding MarR family transcriptional regulator
MNQSLEKDGEIDNLILDNQIKVGFQMLKILKLTRQFIDIEMKELKLSRIGWQVLFWMNILGKCSQKELLYNLDIDAGYLARVLEEFENKGYIVRTPVKCNRRSLLIQMTEYGQDYLMPRVLATIEKESEILFKGVSNKNKKLFIQLLEQLETNMKAAL